MKQIILSEYRWEESKSIIGKTIKDISLTNGNYENAPQLIITFTDDTYVFLNAMEDEDSLRPRFDNGFVDHRYLPGSVCIDDKGNKFFKYRKNIEEQIRLGLIKPDREKELVKIQEHEEQSRKREYELYLELKKKYG